MNGDLNTRVQQALRDFHLNAQLDSSLKPHARSFPSRALPSMTMDHAKVPQGYQKTNKAPQGLPFDSLKTSEWSWIFYY